MSEDMKALLEAQKEAILSFVNDRINGLQQTILKKQEDLDSQIEAENVPLQFKKRGNEQEAAWPSGQGVGLEILRSDLKS